MHLFPHFLCYLLKSYGTETKEVQESLTSQELKRLDPVCAVQALGCHMRPQ